MSKEEKRVPELRFEGFHDDWKQRKLSDMVDTVKSYALSRSFETEKNTGTKYIHYGDIHTKKADKITNKSSIPNIKVGNYEYLRMGDVIIADASEDYQGIAMPAVIFEETVFNIVAGLHTIVLRPHLIDPIYLYYLFYSNSFRKYGYRVGTGMKVFGISKSNVLKFQTLFPSMTEQVRISTLLVKLDNAIALHQRKLEQLRELKKAALQTLFPQKTETEPRVRFANFNEPWKARKLGDYLSIPKKEKKVVKKSDELITVKLNLGGVVLGSSRDTLSLGATAYYVRHSGQLIYGKQNFFNGSIAIIPDNLDGKASSGDVPSFDIININSDYLYTFISRPVYWKQKEAFASGTGSKRIHESTFLNFDICLPNTYDEQQAIGCYFKKLEKLTILYQSKLERLLSLKKSFLQKMFI